MSKKIPRGKTRKNPAFFHDNVKSRLEATPKRTSMTLEDLAQHLGVHIDRVAKAAERLIEAGVFEKSQIRRKK